MSPDLDQSARECVWLGDVVRNVNENVKDLSVAQVSRVIGLEHMDPGELRIRRWGAIAEETTFTRRVRPGQTLFGKRRAYQRKTAYAEFDAVCSGDILVFESADPERLLPELLPFLAMTDSFYDHALRTSAGSLSPRTRWTDLAKYQFDLPPIGAQRRIAKLLWAAEEAVRDIRQSLSALDALEVAKLQELWTATSKLEPLGGLILSSLGGVWGTEPGSAEVDAKVIRGTDITLTGEVTFGQAPIRGLSRSEFSRRELLPGDVLLEKSGGSPDQPVGKSALVSDVPGPAVASNFVVVLRANPALASGAYLALILRGLRATGRLSRFVGKTTGIANLRTRELMNAEVPAINLSDQQALLANFSSLIDARASLLTELDSLDRLKRRLVNEVLS